MEPSIILVVLFVLVSSFGSCECKYSLMNKNCASTDFQTDIDVNETEVEIRFCGWADFPAGALDHLFALETLFLLHMPALQVFPNVKTKL